MGNGEWGNWGFLRRKRVRFINEGFFFNYMEVFILVGEVGCSFTFYF